jgi:hypothetical protein
LPYTTGRFSIAAEGLIVDNVLAIIKRDLKLALDALYTTEAGYLSTDPRYLKDLENRTFGDFMRLAFPALVADLVDGEDEESDDGSRDDETIRIELLLAVTDTDGANVTRRLAKYVRALRVILMSAPWTDYLAGIDPTKIMGPVIVKISRKYLPIGKGKDATESLGYMRACELTLSLSFSER